MSFDVERHKRLINNVEKTVDEKNKEFADHHWRDHFHYMAKSGWINDPCGVIQFRDKYHLFVQHHPFSGKWGQMHWGHAISDDMVHWKHLPEAIVPSESYDDWEGGGIFTGSAIEHDGKLFLFYTACAEDAQTQCIAFSEDGYNFEKFSGNPVLRAAPQGMNKKDFRDPKVWKHGEYWYMVTGTTAGISVLEKASNYEQNGFGKIALHRSPNLIDWEFLSYPVESMGELGTMLECPNFFELDGKFVMMYSPMGMQERQVIYLTGDFDYNTGKFYWNTMGAVDWGFDYYAPQFFVDDTGRTIIFAWAGSWPFMPWCSGEFDTSKMGWYGSITLPRTVRLCADGKLSFAPVSEIEKLRSKSYNEYNVRLAAGEKREIPIEDGNHCEILLDLDLFQTSADKVGLELKSGYDDEKTLVIFDLRRGELVFDRTESGSLSALSRKCPLESIRDRLHLRIFIDSVTVEIFTDGGRTVMTNTVYSKEKNNKIKVFSENGSALVKSIKAFQLEKIKI